MPVAKAREEDFGREVGSKKGGASEGFRVREGGVVEIGDRGVGVIKLTC